MIEALKAIAHPLRMEILRALSDRERNVGEIESAASIGQPALSQQLGVLRKAGLVKARKQGKLVFYSLAQVRIGEIVTLLSNLAGEEGSPPNGVRRPSPGAANFARIAAR